MDARVYRETTAEQKTARSALVATKVTDAISTREFHARLPVKGQIRCAPDLPPTLHIRVHALI